MRDDNIARGTATPTQRVNKAAFSVTNHEMFSASDAMIRLLTNPKVFPKVVTGPATYDNELMIVVCRDDYCDHDNVPTAMMFLYHF